MRRREGPNALNKIVQAFVDENLFGVGARANPQKRHHQKTIKGPAATENGFRGDSIQTRSLAGQKHH